MDPDYQAKTRGKLEKRTVTTKLGNTRDIAQINDNLPGTRWTEWLQNTTLRYERDEGEKKNKPNDPESN